MGFGTTWTKIIFYFLMACGSAMTIVDTGLSIDWIEKTTNSAKVFPFFPLIISFAIAAVNSGIGAIITTPGSWYYALTGGRKIASLEDPLERGMWIGGVGFLSVFLIGGIGYTLYVNLVSNYYKTQNWTMAVAIAFGGDLCFLVANVIFQTSGIRPSSTKMGR